MNSLFVRDNDHYVPTESAASFWSRDTVHGGASTALMVAVMEQHFSSDAMQLARLTVDLFRPIPMAPLRVECRAARNGKRLKLFDVSVFDGEQEVCRSSGLVLERNALDLPEHAKAATGLPDAIKAAMDQAPVMGVYAAGNTEESGSTGGLHTRLEIKPVVFDIGSGRGCVWAKLPLSVIDGLENSRLLNAAALADFANGFAYLQLDENVGFINADITLNLHKMPVGEWLCLDARTQAQPGGTTMVEALVYDELGAIGRISQSNLTMAMS